MLAGLMLRNRILKHIRSDNGAEFDAKVFWEWFSRPEVGTFLIESVGRGRTPTSKTSGQTQVRITQREDLHNVAGSTGIDGVIPPGIQSDPPTQFPGL